MEIAPGGGDFSGGIGIQMQCAASHKGEGMVRDLNLWSEAEPELVGTSRPQGQVLHSPLNKPRP